MTGITKDQLMQMMKEAMALDVYSPHVYSEGGMKRVAHFTNAILERAAKDCETTPAHVETRGYEQASKIRALKINTGD